MIACAILLGIQIDYLRNAHAHNDYAQPQPLENALRLGFASIEVDVFPVNGDLLVGHEQSELRAGRSFKTLYLDPLLKRINRNGGWVYGPSEELTLLVDIKTEGAKAYEILKQQIQPYSQFFTSYRDGDGVKTSAVRIVLSGDRPTAILKAERQRWAFIDGRLADLDREDAELMPIISDSWITHFAWRGVGPLSDKDRFKLELAVQRAKRQKQQLRFWAVPDTEIAWRMMKNYEVGLIGTDKPAELAKFLKG
jgi:glycerophosphoryl diester phosphodiesterase